jgi:hypothetical protein
MVVNLKKNKKCIDFLNILHIQIHLFINDEFFFINHRTLLISTIHCLFFK